MEFSSGLFLNRVVEKFNLLVLPTAGISYMTGMQNILLDEQNLF